MSQTTEAYLNKLTNDASAFHTWAALETALKTGYVPTIRLTTKANRKLNDLVLAAGYRTWNG